MDPVTVGLAVALLVAGWVTGRYARLKSTPKPLQPICLCGHHYGTHDPKTGGCNGVRTFDNGLEYLETTDGVDWLHAPLPRRWHRCRAWARGRFSGDMVYRCACGAISFDQRYWMERNSRRKGAR
jgi:hypothetical protein